MSKAPDGGNFKVETTRQRSKTSRFHYHEKFRRSGKVGPFDQEDASEERGNERISQRLILTLWPKKKMPTLAWEFSSGPSPRAPL